MIIIIVFFFLKKGKVFGAIILCNMYTFKISSIIDWIHNSKKVVLHDDEFEYRSKNYGSLIILVFTFYNFVFHW